MRRWARDGKHKKEFYGAQFVILMTDLDPLNFTEDRPSRDGLHYEVVCPPVDEYKA